MHTSGNAPTLEGMPREIRDQIYGYLLPSTYHVQLEPRRAQRYQLRHRYVPSHPLPPIFPARDRHDEGIEEASSRFPPPPLYPIDPPSKTAPWATESSHGSHRFNRHTRKPLSDRLSLLSTSKQMHSEASATMYAQSTFVFPIISPSRNPLPTNTLNRLRNLEFNILLLDTDYWKTARFSIALLRLFANPDIKRDTCVIRIQQARNHLILHPPSLPGRRQTLDSVPMRHVEARFCSEFRGRARGVARYRVDNFRDERVGREGL